MAEFINLGQRQINSEAIRSVSFEPDGTIAIQYLGGVGGEVLHGAEAEAFRKFMPAPAKAAEPAPAMPAPAPASAAVHGKKHT